MKQDKPIPVLYTDDSKAGKEAESALKAAEVHFQRICTRQSNHESGHLPQLLAGEGSFDTLEDIRWYARLYGKNGNCH